MRTISDLREGDLGSASKYDNALLSSPPDSQCYVGALNRGKEALGNASLPETNIILKK